MTGEQDEERFPERTRRNHRAGPNCVPGKAVTLTPGHHSGHAPRPPLLRLSVFMFLI